MADPLAASPLSKLYVNDSLIKQLVYPSDLGSSRKGHWITFTISVPKNSTYSKNQVQNSILGATTGNNLITPLQNIAINAIQNSLLQTATAIVTAFNSPISQDLWQYTVTPGSTKISTVISLYVADTMSSVLHSHYSAESMTEASGVMGQLAQGIVSVSDMVKNGKGDFDAIKNMATEGVVSSLTGSQALVAAGLKAGGSAINPQMEVFFKHIDFRTFQFDFLFTPRSKAESETVGAIIQAFKFHGAPEIDTDKSVGGRYFIVPSVFEIQIYKDGQVNNNVAKYGICSLETINTDYAPQGWVTHDDGAPVQIRLTLQFKENEIMTKSKIEQGY